MQAFIWEFPKIKGPNMHPNEEHYVMQPDVLRQAAQADWPTLQQGKSVELSVDTVSFL